MYDTYLLTIILVGLAARSASMSI